MVALSPVDRDLALLIGFVLGHFFLFCNIFRVRRGPELVWTAVFLANYGLWHLSGHFWIVGVFLTQIPLTIFLLWRETRKPWYHGIGCRRLNGEHLDEYLRGEV